MGLSRVFFVVFSVAAAAACTHDPSPKVPKIPPPDCEGEDCVKSCDAHLFVGYGEGLNSVTATRNAPIAAGQNAPTCLFKLARFR